MVERAKRKKKLILSFNFIVIKAHLKTEERLKHGDSHTEPAVPNCVLYKLMA